MPALTTAGSAQQVGIALAQSWRGGSLSASAGRSAPTSHCGLLPQSVSTRDAGSGETGLLPRSPATLYPATDRRRLRGEKLL